MLTFNKKLTIYLICFGSLLISFFLGENSSGGAKLDFLATKKFIDLFQIDTNQGFNLFIDEGQVHFPFFYFIVANLNAYFGDFLINILYLFISTSIPFVFYKTLKKKFLKVNKDDLFILSLLIFLSPYFRSSAVWITTDNLALLFIILSIYYFVSFESSSEIKLKYAFYCFFFLILASYIRHYYSIFFVFYFYFIQQKIKLVQCFYLILFNIFFSIPAIVYIFYYMTRDRDHVVFENFLSFDFIFNFLVVTSLSLFYLLPFLFHKDIFNDLRDKIYLKKKFFLIIIFLFLLLFIFYNIPTLNLGGGIIYKLSQLIELKMFILFSFAGFVFFSILNDFNMRNNLLYAVLIFSFPFGFVYQKYYDPLMIVIFLSLINSSYINELFIKKKYNFYLVFGYYFTFLTASNIYYN